MKIETLDHLVLTVKDIATTAAFYQEALGMEKVIFRDNRTALHFGNQKINLHQQGNELEPKAKKPTPGAADLCFITNTEIAEVIQHLDNLNIAIIDGPTPRTGASNNLISIYIRDPDQNLIEIANIVN